MSVRLEELVHKKDAHVADPRVEVFVLFILGLFCFLWKKVSLQ